MKSFISFLIEHLLYEHRAFHGFIKKFGDDILKKMGHTEQYSSLTHEPDHGTPGHMTEYIKKHLGLSDVSIEHGRWILSGIKKGKIENLEDVGSTIIPNLRKFESLKDVHKADLRDVQNPTDLFNIVSKHSPEERDTRFDLEQGKDYEHVAENEHWTVYRPLTEKGSCKLGKGSNWCTASESNNMFHHYTSNNRPLHIFIPKKPKYRGEMYQLHPDEFMTHRNKRLYSPEYPKEGPGFHERPLPKADHVPEMFSARLQDAIAGNHPAETQLDLIKNHTFGTHPDHITHALSSQHPEVGVAAVQHPNFGTHPDHLKVATRHPEVGVAAVQHPNFGTHPDHMEYALSSRHREVAMAAFRHPNFGTNSYHISSASHSPHKEVAMAAFRHPNFGTHPDHISSASHSPHKEVAMAAIQHPNFGTHPDHITHALYYSPHKEVVMAAMQHPNFGTHPDHTLNRLYYSPHKEVAMAAIQHPDFGTDPDHITHALQSRHREVAMAAVRHPNFGTHPNHMEYALSSRHPEVQDQALHFRVRDLARPAGSLKEYINEIYDIT